MVWLYSRRTNNIRVCIRRQDSIEARERDVKVSHVDGYNRFYDNEFIHVGCEGREGERERVNGKGTGGEGRGGRKVRYFEHNGTL
jgi:hypothetical protein